MQFDATQTHILDAFDIPPSLREAWARNRTPHITHGCDVAEPSPDGIRRHDFTTLERIDPRDGHVKTVACKHCAKKPGQL